MENENKRILKVRNYEDKEKEKQRGPSKRFQQIFGGFLQTEKQCM